MLSFNVVGVKGLEPSTSRSQTARASQLRHTPRNADYIIQSVTYLTKYILVALYTKVATYHGG
jgi:hypothetical protein